MRGLAFDEIVRDRHGRHVAHPCAIALDEAPDDLGAWAASLLPQQRRAVFDILKQQQAEASDTRGDDGPKPFGGMPLRGGGQIPRGAFDERPRGSFSERFPETAHIRCEGGGLRPTTRERR